MKMVMVESKKEMKKVYAFFKELDNTPLPSFKEYYVRIQLGECWAIYDKDDIVGGLVQYSMPTHNTILNCYIPEEQRAKSMFWKMIENTHRFQMKYPHKKTYATSKDISEWRRFAKHIKDDLYQVMLPRIGAI